MSKNYQQLFRDIVTVLRRDYAGGAWLDERFAPRYYTQAVGQAWNDGRLDDLLFLRYVSQMLACIGDRNLNLTKRPDGEYTPWGPGFYTRRYGDDLYVTAVTGEAELSAGDRITAINGGSPAKHKALAQKDFFRGSVPEREDWNGLLKMAEHVDVVRPDGTEARVVLKRHPIAPPVLTPAAEDLGEGIVYLRPAPFEPAADTAGWLEENRALLTGAKALILDLRNARGGDEGEILPLLELLCREEMPLSKLLDNEVVINCSRLNCILKAAVLEGVEGAEEYMAELAALADTGYGTESLGYEEETVLPLAPERVAVLTDTWCRDAGETLALAAKRAGAVLIGRETLGTVHTFGTVHYELDERFVLSWPTAMSRSARDGETSPGAGVVPDVCIPWTPEELGQDVLLHRALAYIREK